jgi:hypothetical protein
MRSGELRIIPEVADSYMTTLETEAPAVSGWRFARNALTKKISNLLPVAVLG